MIFTSQYILFVPRFLFIGVLWYVPPQLWLAWFYCVVIGPVLHLKSLDSFLIPTLLTLNNEMTEQKGDEVKVNFFIFCLSKWLILWNLPLDVNWRRISILDFDFFMSASSCGMWLRRYSILNLKIYAICIILSVWLCYSWFPNLLKV